MVTVCESQDMLTLRRLYKATLPLDPWTITDVARFWIASDEQGPCGMIALEPAMLTPNDFFVPAVGVLKRASGRSIAYKLIRTVERWAKVNSQRDAIVTYVMCDNGPSLASFFKAGWRVYWPTEWTCGGGVVYFRKDLR